MISSTLPSLALLLCTAAAAAQGTQPQVTFTGVIQPATLPSICQEETHFLTCSGPSPFAPTGALLKSSTLDLKPFEGVNARFTAVQRGVTCPILDVTAVQVPPTATLDFCGNPVPGCPVRFRVGPSGVIGRYSLFLGFGPELKPLSPTAGTQLIADPVVLFAQGNTFGSEETVDVTVPFDVALTGLSLWFQGVRQDIGPVGPPELTNAICFTILGPSPPCLQPGC